MSQSDCSSKKLSREFAEISLHDQAPFPLLTHHRIPPEHLPKAQDQNEVVNRALRARTVLVAKDRPASRLSFATEKYRSTQGWVLPTPFPIVMSDQLQSLRWPLTNSFPPNQGRHISILLLEYRRSVQETNLDHPRAYHHRDQHRR